MITIWIVDRINGTLSLCDVPQDTLKNYQRVRALSDGEWFSLDKESVDYICSL